jgi:putative Mn2+ efflux pump MntP
MMSFALGMDSLSLSIGVGLSDIRRRTAVQLCLTIGVFHVVFTFMGLMFGNMIGQYLGAVAHWFGVLLLFGLGVHMLYTSLRKDEEKPASVATAIAMLLFSATVSLDALSVGFSLGLRSATYGVVSAISFGFVSMFMCGIGLLVGKKFGQSIGKYGEILGAFVLISCGFMFLF